MKNAADNATPSANGMAIRGLFRISNMTGNTAFGAARAAVRAFATNIDRRPEYFPTILRGLIEHMTTPGAHL